MYEQLCYLKLVALVQHFISITDRTIFKHSRSAGEPDAGIFRELQLWSERRSAELSDRH